MSVAGWQEGIAQDLHVNCTGGAEFYGRRFGCWVKSWARPGQSGKSHLPVLRRILLHAGGKAGHRADCQIRHCLRFGPENWDRPAQRSERRNAVGRVENPELQAEVVCRRNDLSRHRTGSGRDHAGAVAARDFRNFDGWPHGGPARGRSATSCPAATSRPVA